MRREAVEEMVVVMVTVTAIVLLQEWKPLGQGLSQSEARSQQESPLAGEI